MELIEFFWQRCTAGYEIVWSDADRARTSSNWYPPKTPSPAIVSRGNKFEVYQPTKFPALFQIFADTGETAEGMKDFASRFGLLGAHFDSRRGIRQSRPVLQHPTLTYEAAGVGEMLGHHRALCRAAGHFESGNSLELIERFNPDGGNVRIELRAQPDGSVAPVFVPANLLEFMWLQLALHASSHARIFRCERCGMPFRVGSGTGRRETAMFCSGACKQATFKERQKERETDNA